MVAYKANWDCLNGFDAKCAAQNLLSSSFFLRVGIGAPPQAGKVATS